MIVTIEKDVVSNIQSSKDFSITSDSARLFRMLSDFLYSNKEVCVLHEISANALDAHKLVGKEDVPFVIYSPTKLEPKLRIRDFGPGLSEEDVYKLLTTYGESGEHKRKSNDYVGGWGIGSKSVASVTDTWNITSFFDGLEKQFLIFVNSQGIPTMTKIFETSTTETGLEVSIPVDSTKFYSWTSVYQQVFQHYKVKPTIKNYSISWRQELYNYCTENFAFARNNVYQTRLVINQREYSLDKSKIKKELEAHNKKYLFSFIEKNEFLVLFMPTGSIELSVSREQVQYTKFTINNIIHHLDKCFNSLVDSYHNNVKDYKNSLEYRAQFISWTSSIVKNSIDHWGYKSLYTEIIKTNDPFKVSDIDTFFRNYVIPLSSKEFEDTDIKVIHNKRMSSLKTGFKCFGSYAVNYKYNDGITIKLSYLDRVEVVVNDVRGAASRIKNHYVGQYIILVDSLEYPKEFEPYVVKASTLPKVPRLSSGPKQKSNSTVYELYKNSFRRIGVNTVDMSNCVYVEFTDSRTKDSIVNPHKLVWWKVKDYLYDNGIKVLGIKQNTTKPNCKSMYQYLKDKHDSLLGDSRLDVQYSTYQRQCTYKFSDVEDIFDRVVGPIGSYWETARKELIADKALNEHLLYDQYRRLCDVLNIKEKDFSNVETYNKKVNKLLDIYPMIRYTKYERESCKEIYNYICLINK